MEGGEPLIMGSRYVDEVTRWRGVRFNGRIGMTRSMLWEYG